jgi:pimeloyl-[acyl-carrier protein] methyl ester esterase
VTLHVESVGRGPDLVLLHGWGLHSGVWSEVLPALAARMRVHAIDLPGHGHSVGVEARSFDEATDAVAALVPRGAAVCGWSLGGLIAQRLAYRHPDRVARLALVATTPCFGERPGWPHGMKAATLAGFTEALEKDPETMLRRFVALNAMHGPQGRDAVRAFTRRLLERGAPPKATLAATMGWLREVDLRAQTAGLRVPSAVVHGRRDIIVPVGAAEWLARNVAGARHVELGDAAHMPFFSHRDVFAATIEGLVG